MDYIDNNILFIIIFSCIIHNYISMMEYITAIFCKYRNRFESATSSLIDLELDDVDIDNMRVYEDDGECLLNNSYKNNGLDVIKCIDCETVFDNKSMLYTHIYSKRCTKRDTHVRYTRLDNRQQISDNERNPSSKRSSQQISDNSRKPTSNSNQQISTNLINYGSAYTYSENNQLWEYFGNILIEPKIDNYKHIIFDEVNNNNIINNVQFAILTGENIHITNFNEIIDKIAEYLTSCWVTIDHKQQQVEDERKDNEQYKNIIEHYKIELLALHKKVSLLNDKLKNSMKTDKTQIENYEESIKKYEADVKKYKSTIEELNKMNKVLTDKANNTIRMNNYLASIMA
jgi:hypothetical protein